MFLAPPLDYHLKEYVKMTKNNNNNNNTRAIFLKSFVILIAENMKHLKIDTSGECIIWRLLSNISFRL